MELVKDCSARVRLPIEYESDCSRTRGICSCFVGAFIPAAKNTIGLIEISSAVIGLAKHEEPN